MNFQDFLLKFNGQKDVGNTPENIGECTGIVNVYAQELGLPHLWGHGKDIFALADERFYDKILNTPDYIPQQGDIICKNGGKYGHVAIATGTGDAHKYEVFEQNVPIGGGCRLHTYNDEYLNVIGGLRPKTPTTGVDPVILAQSDAFIAICTKLNLPANRDVVLGELDKLIGYEDKLIEKDKQLSEAQAKATELETTIAQRDEELKKLQGEINGLKEKVDIAVVNNNEMSNRIEQLKKDCQPQVTFVGWRKMLIDFISKL